MSSNKDFWQNQILNQRRLDLETADKLSGQRTQISHKGVQFHESLQRRPVSGQACYWVTKYELEILLKGFGRFIHANKGRSVVVSTAP